METYFAGLSAVVYYGLTKEENWTRAKMEETSGHGLGGDLPHIDP